MRDSLTEYRRPFWKSPLVLGAAAIALFVAVVGTLIALAVAGSGSSGYSYADYGQSVNGRFNCYYEITPAEVANDIALGYCPRNSVAVLAPIGWQESHWYIYDSSNYSSRVVPVAYRSRYSSYTLNFSRTYSSSISKYSSNKSVSGYSAPKTVTTHGGGSLRGSCSEAMTTVHLRGGSGTGSGSGSSSGSHGGGSLRGGTSGGTTSRTGTTSGSHC